MAFWTVKTDDESISEGSGGNYILNSGMYPVTIKECIVRKSAPDSGKRGMWLDLIVDYSGSIQTIYRAIGMRNNDGSPNFGENLFNKLCIVCGGKDGFSIGEPTKKSVCVNQKEKTYEECEVLQEFENRQVILRMLKSYRKYDGRIRRNMELKNVFRETDKASAAEIIKNAENKGAQYEKELVTCHEINYKDGITEEEAKAFEKAQMYGDKQPEAKPAKRRFGFGSEEQQDIDGVPF